jgi:hypothetical protein
MFIKGHVYRFVHENINVDYKIIAILNDGELSTYLNSNGLVLETIGDPYVCDDAGYIVEILGALDFNTAFNDSDWVGISKDGALTRMDYFHIDSQVAEASKLLADIEVDSLLMKD